MTWYDKGGGGVKIPEKTSDVINERPLRKIIKDYLPNTYGCYVTHYVLKCTNTHAMFIVMCTYKNNKLQSEDELLM